MRIYIFTIAQGRIGISAGMSLLDLLITIIDILKDGYIV